jgi:hypothetical protein
LIQAVKVKEIVGGEKKNERKSQIFNKFWAVCAYGENC